MRSLIAIAIAMMLAGCFARPSTPTMRTTVDVYLFPGAQRADGCKVRVGEDVRIIETQTVTDPDMTPGVFAKVQTRTCTGWVQEALIKE